MKVSGMCVAAIAALLLCSCNESDLAGEQFEQIARDASSIRYIQFNATTVQQWEHRLGADCFESLNPVTYRQNLFSGNGQTGVLEFDPPGLPLPTGTFTALEFQREKGGKIILRPPGTTPVPLESATESIFDPNAWFESRFTPRRLRPLCLAPSGPTPTPPPAPSQPGIQFPPVTLTGTN